VALLGQIADDEIARRTGRSWQGVRAKRESLAIPNPTARPGSYTREPWSAEEDDLVRTLPPAEVVAGTGRTLQAVYFRRGLLGLTGGRRGPKAAERGRVTS
jgi:hypothetical protein